MRDDLRQSFARIIGFQLVFTLIILIVAAIIFGYYTLRADLRSKVDIIGARVTAEISTISSALDGLAKSPILWTALTDTTDRDVHLMPLLDGLNQTQTHRLGVLDYSGREFVVPADFYIDNETFRQALAGWNQGTQSLFEFVDQSETGLHVLIITPIVSPMSQSVVGYAIGAYGVDRSLELLQSVVGTQIEMGFTAPAQPDAFDFNLFAVSMSSQQVIETPRGEVTFFVRVTDSFKYAFFSMLAILAAVVLVGLYARRLGNKWAAGFAARLLSRLDLLVDQSRNIWQGKEIEVQVDEVGDEISEVRGTLIKLLKDQKSAVDQLKTAARIYETAGEAIMVIDRSGTIVNVNAALLSITGYAENELVGQPAKTICASADADDDHSVQAMTHQDGWRGDLLILNKASQPIPVQLAISVVRDAQGVETGRVAVFSDIREIKEAQDRLRELAYQDLLTGLPNYRAFMEFTQRQIERSTSESSDFLFLFIDLDRFKQVNDLYGHEKGDEIIRAVAQHFEAHLPHGHFLARRSADEFLGLIPVPKGQTMESLRTLLGPQLTQWYFDSDSLSFDVSASIGVTQFPRYAQSFATLLKQTDFALSEAKNRGLKGEVVWYDDDLGDKIYRRLTIKAALPEAIRAGRIKAFFQPEVDLLSGEIRGFEALARWNDPKLGEIAPDEFIVAAEESDWIVELSDAMLTQVLDAIPQLLKQFPKVKVAFNASPRLFANNHLLNKLQTIGQDNRRVLESLVLEITESNLTTQASLFSEQLQLIRHFGVQVAIDDFGKGHSSLIRLASMPIDKLKIDAAFVAGIGTAVQENIIGVLIALGRTLDVKVVAEGVETPVQASWLRAAGCSRAQGWYYAKAMPLEDALRLHNPIIPGAH